MMTNFAQNFKMQHEKSKYGIEKKLQTLDMVTLPETLLIRNFSWDLSRNLELPRTKFKWKEGIWLKDYER